MKFSIALAMERFSPDKPMQQVVNETLELVRMADAGASRRSGPPSITRSSSRLLPIHSRS